VNLHDEMESDAQAATRFAQQCASLNSIAARYAREADRWRGVAFVTWVLWAASLAWAIFR
jgi:hypothetical protein